MSWRGRWVVLVPGDADWVEKRARELMEEIDDESLDEFTVISGQGRYHAIVETGGKQREPEVLLGDAFSRELNETVYVIEGKEESPEIMQLLRGDEIALDQDAEELVRSLGCKVPWFDQSSPSPFKRRTRTVAFIQGISMAQARRTLNRIAGKQLSFNSYRLVESPQGVLLTDGAIPLAGEQIDLAEKFPRATVYSVAATPTLDSFVVTVMRGRQTSEFVHPPGSFAYFPVVHEIMGARTPEEILAAMGIPKDWFQL